MALIANEPMTVRAPNLANIFRGHAASLFFMSGQQVAMAAWKAAKLKQAAPASWIKSSWVSTLKHFMRACKWDLVGPWKWMHLNIVDQPTYVSLDYNDSAFCKKELSHISFVMRGAPPSLLSGVLPRGLTQLFAEESPSVQHGAKLRASASVHAGTLGWSWLVPSSAQDIGGSSFGTAIPMLKPMQLALTSHAHGVATSMLTPSMCSGVVTRALDLNISFRGIFSRDVLGGPRLKSDARTLMLKCLLGLLQSGKHFLIAVMALTKHLGCQMILRRRVCFTRPVPHLA
jgi:hypothetical protein